MESHVFAACIAKGADCEAFAGSVTDRAGMAALLLDLDKRYEFDLIIANGQQYSAHPSPLNLTSLPCTSVT
jgi:hypothetical protein